MDLSKMHTITILTDNDFSVKQWMIEQTNVAEDIGVHNSQLSRFMSGNTVTDAFYDKWFKWYIQN